MFGAFTKQQCQHAAGCLRAGLLLVLLWVKCPLHGLLPSNTHANQAWLIISMKPPTNNRTPQIVSTSNHAWPSQSGKNRHSPQVCTLAYIHTCLRSGCCACVFSHPTVSGNSNPLPTSQATCHCTLFCMCDPWQLFTGIEAREATTPSCMTPCRRTSPPRHAQTLEGTSTKQPWHHLMAIHHDIIMAQES